MIDLTKFQKMKCNFEKLKGFGFSKVGDYYEICKEICGGDLLCRVKIDKNEKIILDVIDNMTGEKYSLFYVSNAQGSFLGQINKECENFVHEIVSTCFNEGSFLSDQTYEIVRFVKDKLGGELEYLWEKFPEYAIWRRGDNQKWYAILMLLPKCKLDGKSKENVEVLNVKVPTDEIDYLVDNKRIFKGFHSNKKHWISICLDKSLDNSKIFRLIEQSYNLTKK